FELRVASCELRVSSCELRVARRECGVETAGPASVWSQNKGETRCRTSGSLLYGRNRTRSYLKCTHKPRTSHPRSDSASFHRCGGPPCRFHRTSPKAVRAAATRNSRNS